MTRITNKNLYGITETINSKLIRLGYVGGYGVEFACGQTDVVFHADQKLSSSSYTIVRAGLTKSEAYDILYGINHAISLVFNGKQ